jgi:hypothetical protein
MCHLKFLGTDKPRLSNQKKNPQDKDSTMNMDQPVWKPRKHHSCQKVASAEARDDNRENEARHCGEKYVISSHSGLADHHFGHDLPPDESISRTINFRSLKFLLLKYTAWRENFRIVPTPSFPPGLLP